MLRRIFLVVLTAVVAWGEWGTGGGQRCLAANRPSDKPPSAAQTAAAQEMLAAIRKGNETTRMMFETGNATLDSFVSWSRRLVEAQQLIGADRDGMQHALKCHVGVSYHATAKAMALRNSGSGRGDDASVSSCTFEFAEANYWLACHENESPTGGWRKPSARQIVMSKAMMAAADLEFKAIIAQFEFGGASVATLCRADRHRTQACLLVAKTRNQRRQAIEDYVKQTKSVAQRTMALRSAGDQVGNDASYYSSLYFLAEAKYWLADLEAQDDDKRAEARAARWTAAKQMTGAAKYAYETTHAMQFVGSADLPDVCQWSQRLAEAQQLVATSKAERRQALVEHLQRASELAARIEALLAAGDGKGSADSLYEAQFHRARAAYLLASLDNE